MSAVCSPAGFIFSSGSVWTSRLTALLICSRFVVGAAVVHALNMTAIYFGTREPREKTAPAPMLEEKGNGAIMLY